ncbi:hypothetical protein C5E02_04835 [Rathayibacter rathayi]|uniref:DUF4333 domain-containing protein n=1 Tax=Rathayibacter rathayi TaxID=33887 RepID=A0ABD6W985_RATRA|nr:hypothetical protein [Rathayibacter rathayi]PPF14458.1 hypothetical protein C5C04_06765 [Rathayibacter rathayi]PPG14991.1 hypothetical protein C5C11_03570 [Rathayibacter rathayi]PPG46972.1 hypothetical protein C5C20_01710 [Rathayibacter rathayi]PPG89937.1 hypothetical protein C5C47_02710 [Rathayibacter rathayi]PPG96705.1 hypothetical protein C5C00_07915 [Rathayibacter rathayi]
MTDAAPTPAKNKPVTIKGLFLIIAAAIAIPAALFTIGSYVNSGDNTSANRSSYEAAAQCEARIGRLLKAPATAAYDSNSTGTGGSWTVTGTVDAQNAFGTLVRSTYQCTVVMHDAAGTATTTVDSFTGN